MSELISSGINLMLTGMITVFIFLAILIILINISALLFKDYIEVEKIKGTENPADLLTKYKDLESIKLYAGWTNCSFETGRHELMPQVSEKEGFHFTQTETTEDGSIRLVLRRFN